ncbi:MAG: pyridoxal-phosphate-dependent aminotransferase family protein [Thermodesulfobacteriota bacterium]
MKKRYLLAPGPTPVPAEVSLSMAQPVIHHRTPQFSEILEEARDGLKEVFQTEEDVLVLASSGTGAMESAISNLFSEGDRVLVINGGKFGERWGKIAEAYGLKVSWVDVEWGKAVEVSRVKEQLDADSAIKGVFVQGSETSTTVSHPVKELAELTRDREDCLLVVDGITSVGVFPLPMDEWGIDVLLGGSQKAFMLPPGLAFIALSEKAWGFADNSQSTRFYFDLRKERKAVKGSTTAYTPAISLITGLREALRMMREEGIENMYKRHNRLARATRAAVEAIGLKLLAPDAPSDAATGAWTPEGIDGKAFVKSLRDEFGVTVAGGQDDLKGKIIRIAHMGYIDTFDVVIAISAIEMALKRFGHNVVFGKGVAAAQEILMEGYK